MSLFGNIVQSMAGMDLFHLFFPWILVLAVTYGVLTKYEVISGDESINGVISLSVAFLTIGGAAMFIPEGAYTQLVGLISFGIMSLIGILILMAVAGYDISQLADMDRSPLLAFAIGIGVVSITVVVLTNVDLSPLLNLVSDVSLDFESIMPVLILLFMLLVVVFATPGSSE